MKKVTFLLLIMICTIASAEPIPAEITLLDGSEFEGYADITKKNKIEFRFERSDEPETMDELEIKRIRFLEYPFGTYEYLYYKNRFKLLKLIVEGSINVYAQYPESFSTQKSEAQKKREDYINHEKKTGFNGSMYYSGSGFNMRQKRYWIKDISSGKIDDIKLDFRKEARIWFADCPEIIEYTDSKEWKYNDLKTIVEFYNEFCGTE